MKLVWLNRITILLSCLGLFVAGVMSYSSLSQKMVPCLAGSTGCAQLSASAFGQWFGIPVAYFGLLGYALLLVLGVLRTLQPAKFKSFSVAGLAISAFGAVASLWLTFAALALMQLRCEWCLSSMVAMVALFVIHGYLVQVGEASEELGKENPIMIPVAGVVAALALTGFTISGMDQAVSNAGQMAPTNLAKVEAEQLIPTPDRLKGNPDAKVTLVEIADIRCPGCRRAWPRIKAIYDQYGGRLRKGFRHLPLTQIPGHENAGQAAIIAELAALDGKFWQYLDAVYSATNDERVKTLDGLISIATGVGLDANEIGTTLNSMQGAAVSRVVADVALAQKIGIGGTPTFLLVANGKSEAVSLDNLEQVLRREPYASLLK